MRHLAAHSRTRWGRGAVAADGARSANAATRPGSWVELPAAAGLLALHQATGDAGDCELAFEADEPLEAVVARLAAAGYPAGPILDESLGRSVRVRDPDGVHVQVNENDRSLYR